MRTGKWVDGGEDAVEGVGVGCLERSVRGWVGDEIGCCAGVAGRAEGETMMV